MRIGGSNVDRMSRLCDFLKISSSPRMADDPTQNAIQFYVPLHSFYSNYFGFAALMPFPYALPTVVLSVISVINYPVLSYLVLFYVVSNVRHFTVLSCFVMPYYACPDLFNHLTPPLPCSCSVFCPALSCPFLL